jgi:hypothetical protein
LEILLDQIQAKFGDIDAGTVSRTATRMKINSSAGDAAS